MTRQITVRLPEPLAERLEAIAEGQRIGTLASHLLAEAVACREGLDDVPRDWLIQGIGQWPRKPH